MINIDDRLLPKVNESEMWLILNLAKRFGESFTAFPSNKTLLEDTGWHIEKLQRVKKSLAEKRILKIKVRKNASNLYTINTEYLGVYINGKGKIIEAFEGSGKTDIPPGKTDIPYIGKTDRATPGKTDNEVLTNEVLTNEPKSTASQLLKIIYDLRIEFTPDPDAKKRLRIPAETDRRVSLIRRAQKEFHQAFGKDKPFIEGVRFVLRYKAVEWSKDPMMWKYFDPETLFNSENFIKYCEAAKRDNGRPPVKPVKNMSAIDTPSVASNPESYHTTPRQ